MYSTYIHQIANILTINHQKLGRTGLLAGHLGVALFLYRYSRLYALKDYELLADDILDYTIEKHLKAVDRPFSFGIFGFGWLLRHLTNNRFVETDEESFQDIEKIIRNGYSKYDMEADLKDSVQLFSLGLYGSQLDDAATLDRIFQALEFVRDNLQEGTFSVSYAVSILYFLHSYERKRGESLLTSNMKTFFENCLLKAWTWKTHTRQDLYTLHSMGLGGMLPSLVCVEELNLLEDVYSNWQTIIYADVISIEEDLPSDELGKYLKGVECDVPFSRLSLNGLASLGCNLLLKEENIIT